MRDVDEESISFNDIYSPSEKSHATQPGALDARGLILEELKLLLNQEKPSCQDLSAKNEELIKAVLSPSENPSLADDIYKALNTPSN